VGYWAKSGDEAGERRLNEGVVVARPAWELDPSRREEGDGDD